ncbi:hypothetical protein CIPAW_16G082500 [Carya illinoinensis]|uniref:Uncharacterized protein n=1 Tax=Carya illinoinensis TaxID=32201 RepID=A0A8T1N5A4_CARIL|nr:hypothetical protein CIPAW_16G082500 [Carya illinoinensis]
MLFYHTIQRSKYQDSTEVERVFRNCRHRNETCGRRQEMV